MSQGAYPLFLRSSYQNTESSGEDRGDNNIPALRVWSRQALDICEPKSFCPFKAHNWNGQKISMCTGSIHKPTSYSWVMDFASHKHLINKQALIIRSHFILFAVRDVRHKGLEKCTHITHTTYFKQTTNFNKNNCKTRYIP